MWAVHLFSIQWFVLFRSQKKNLLFSCRLVLLLMAACYSLWQTFAIYGFDKWKFQSNKKCARPFWDWLIELVLILTIRRERTVTFQVKLSYTRIEFVLCIWPFQLRMVAQNNDNVYSNHSSKYGHWLGMCMNCGGIWAFECVRLRASWSQRQNPSGQHLNLSNSFSSMNKQSSNPFRFTLQMSSPNRSSNTFRLFLSAPPSIFSQLWTKPKGIQTRSMCTSTKRKYCYFLCNNANHCKPNGFSGSLHPITEWHI